MFDFRLMRMVLKECFQPLANFHGNALVEKQDEALWRPFRRRWLVE